VHLFLERPVAVSQQYADARTGARFINGNNVEVAVVVEIPGGRKNRIAPCIGIPGNWAERAVAITKHHSDGVAAGIRHNQIKDADITQIAHSDETSASLIENGFPKGSIPIAKQYSGLARIVAYDGEVEESVLIEIADCDRLWLSRDRDIGSRLELSQARSGKSEGPRDDKGSLEQHRA